MGGGATFVEGEVPMSNHTNPDAPLSRRGFGKRLLLGASALAVVLGVGKREEAQAASATTAWRMGGNADVNTDGSNFLGTLNIAPLIFKTANSAGNVIERVRILTNGNVGVGLTNPAARLHARATASTALIGDTSSTNFGATGVLGELRTTTPGSDAAGVRGVNNGTTANGVGVRGIHASSGVGVHGTSTSGRGVQGDSNYAGLWGEGGDYGAYTGATKNSGQNYGIFATTNSQAGYAGYFSGRVHVQGTLSKSAGSFKIDHPLDPENKYLSHSFVESPDMKNVYDGNVTTDANGDATVTLPAYFEALNRDFRYQLTVIGQFAQAVVATKIKNNQFTIKTDKPSVEVSWQVTGIRQDAYAKAHPIPVEEEKTGSARGRFLSPLEHGRPASHAEVQAPRAPAD
jgi:hypothetical protein